MRVLLRCDGGGHLGVGHVMRSLALAEAAVDAGHEVVVAGYFEGSFLAAQLDAAPVQIAPTSPWRARGDVQPLIALVRRLAGRSRTVDRRAALRLLPPILAAEERALARAQASSKRLLARLKDMEFEWS